jgi:hypothetical protein
MHSYRKFLTLSALTTAITISHTTSAFSTDFVRSEGYIASALDQSKQTSAAYFNEAPFAGGFYLPKGGKPELGILRRDPKATGATAYYKVGAGSVLNTGATYAVSLDFTFEGLPGGIPSVDAYMGSVGFSTSSTSNKHAIYAGIKRDASGSNSAEGVYQFFVSGGGYAEVMGGVSYTAVGDDLLDDNDLTDNLRMILSLTKSMSPGKFEAVAQLLNLNTATTVATITTTLTESSAYQSDLFGYFKSGSIREVGNFDLFNVTAFSFNSVVSTP